MIQNAKVKHDKGRTTVTAPCIITKKEHSVTVDTKGYYHWVNGELIQRALPGVSADDREFLISGTSPEGWKQLYGDEE